MIYCWVKSLSVWCIVLGKVISLVKLGLSNDVGSRGCLYEGVGSKGLSV